MHNAYRPTTEQLYPTNLDQKSNRMMHHHLHQTMFATPRKAAHSLLAGVLDPMQPEESTEVVETVKQTVV